MSSSRDNFFISEILILYVNHIESVNDYYIISLDLFLLQML